MMHIYIRNTILFVSLKLLGRFHIENKILQAMLRKKDILKGVEKMAYFRNKPQLEKAQGQEVMHQWLVKMNYLRQ